MVLFSNADGTEYDANVDFFGIAPFFYFVYGFLCTLTNYCILYQGRAARAAMQFQQHWL